jgi:maleate cis-trans isomerase
VVALGQHSRMAETAHYLLDQGVAFMMEKPMGLNATVVAGHRRPEADALLCSCTAWRSLEAVAELEQRTGKPVVNSSQASIWAAYRAIGLKPKITAFGRLLESLAA